MFRTTSALAGMQSSFIFQDGSFGLILRRLQYAVKSGSCLVRSQVILFRIYVVVSCTAHATAAQL